MAFVVILARAKRWRDHHPPVGSGRAAWPIT